jgi:hypothetical protein
MPTNRKRVRREGKNEGWMVEVLLLGYCLMPNGEKNYRRGLTVWDPPLPAWADVEAELLPGWIREHPASRPWAWWKDAAPEPRRRVGGSGRRGRNASLEFGVPTDTWFKDVDPDNPPIYESQAAYLRRLDLLTPAEKKWLAGHPEALEPEAIEYRLAIGPEVYYVGYKGPGYYEASEDI